MMRLSSPYSRTRLPALLGDVAAALLVSLLWRRMEWPGRPAVVFGVAFVVTGLLARLLADSRERSWRSHLRNVTIDVVTTTVAFVAISYVLGGGQ